MEQSELFVRITGIEIVAKEMAPRPKVIPGPEQFVFKINNEIQIQQKTKSLATFVDVLILDRNDHNKQYAKLTTAMFIEIKNFNEALIKEGDGFVLPKNLIDSLRTQSISTARGILYSEFRGTYLYKAFVPFLTFDQLNSGNAMDDEEDVLEAANIAKPYVKKSSIKVAKKVAKK